MNLEIIEGMIGHVSGTPGVGTFTWCHAYQAASVTAAEATAIKRCLFTSQKNTVALAWSAATLTGSVVHQVLAHFPTSPFAGERCARRRWHDRRAPGLDDHARTSSDRDVARCVGVDHVRRGGEREQLRRRRRRLDL